eukprot:UN01350
MASNVFLNCLEFSDISLFFVVIISDVFNNNLAVSFRVLLQFSLLSLVNLYSSGFPKLGRMASYVSLYLAKSTSQFIFDGFLWWYFCFSQGVF